MIVNASESLRCFTWTIPKTASRTAWHVFSNFDFNCYNIVDGDLVLKKEGFRHNHNTHFFNGHDNYDFIMTIRNPYRMILSKISSYSKEKIIFSLEREIFIENNWQKQLQEKLKVRTPDYIIRVENIQEDYLNIPFIKESEYFKSGELKKFLDLEYGKGFMYDWKELMDSTIADLIYYNHLFLFEIFGYNKDSWKK